MGSGERGRAVNPRYDNLKFSQVGIEYWLNIH